MNFLDMMKAKALQGWQQLQAAHTQQGKDVQQWYKNSAPLQQMVQQPQPSQPSTQPQQPQMGSLQQQIAKFLQQGGQGIQQGIQSIPSAQSINANAEAMKKQFMQSQMMQKLMGMFR
jgi:hypothetical protein